MKKTVEIDLNNIEVYTLTEVQQNLVTGRVYVGWTAVYGSRDEAQKRADKDVQDLVISFGEENISEEKDGSFYKVVKLSTQEPVKIYYKVLVTYLH